MNQLHRKNLASTIDDTEIKVSHLELFFDLAFAFTITQITDLIMHTPHDLFNLFKVLLVLIVICWMYSGYAWLTNNIGTERLIYRILMLCSMTGFLVMAISIPHVYENGGIPFGIAFLLVTTIHILLFRQSSNVTSFKAITAITPLNLSVALFVLASGILNNRFEWSWWLWVVAVLIILLASIERQGQVFDVNTKHIAERHGLIILIALGESIIAIGLSASEVNFNISFLVFVLTELIIVIALWWSYFDKDAILAEKNISQLSDIYRYNLTAYAYWHAHLIMIAGIIISGAGIQESTKHLNEHLVHSSSWYLSAGIAV